MSYVRRVRSFLLWVLSRGVVVYVVLNQNIPEAMNWTATAGWTWERLEKNYADMQVKTGATHDGKSLLISMAEFFRCVMPCCVMLYASCSQISERCAYLPFGILSSSRNMMNVDTKHSQHPQAHAERINEV